MSKTNSKIVEEVVADYLARREARRSLEAQWQLNINFIMGNQYSYIAANGGINQDTKQYFWQEKEVFNQIAPIVETRISKICSNTPNVTVVPATTDEADIESAKLSKEIINSVSSRLNLPDIVKTATHERKSTCILGSAPIKSRTGFMITPPPRPTNAPSDVARRITAE